MLQHNLEHCSLSVDLSGNFLEVFEAYKEKIYDWMYNAIIFAMKNDLDDIDVFKLIDKTSGDSYTININRENFNESLESMVKYYSSIENYNACDEIEKTIQTIN